MSVSGAVLSSPLLAAPDSSQPTFARRRLRLGIRGVGVSVVLSVVWLVALWLVVPETARTWRLLPGLLGIALTAATGAMAFVLAHTLLVLPLEHAGGRNAVRSVPALGAWLASWVRGVLVLCSVAVAATAMVAVSGALGGPWLAATSVAAFAVIVLALQGPLARGVASLTLRRVTDDEAAACRAAGVAPDHVRIVRVDDEAFVGGWTGVGPWRTLWIPERWCAADARELLQVQLVRRAAQRTSRARQRGWWRAAAWPALGVLITTAAMPLGWQDARLWLALPALATLWAFVGVLLLPAVSRPAVFAADALAARALGADAVARTIARLDAWQDDERERTHLVEFIFHPVPAAGRRLRALVAAQWAPLGGGHQQARLALLAGWTAGSVLGRVVHCNLGRPALWVVYPGD